MRLLGWLCPMPDGYYPHCCLLDTVEETIRRHNHFAVGQVRELWYHPTRLRKLLKPPDGLLRRLPEADGGGRVLPAYIGESGEKLGTTCGREADSHRGSSVRRVSASANTASRSYPMPAAISCSPRTRSRSNCRSRSPRSYASTLSMMAAARPRWVITRG